MFNQRSNATPKINYIGGAPRIWVRPTALAKMWYYVQGCADEIGWLGTVTRYDSNNWIIEDTLLFEQEVHSTTCELTPQGLAKVAEQILMQPGGMEVYNSIRLWGHSHVNMGVSPSGQDESQMKTFEDTGCEWFIRVIANKKGEMEFALYDYTTGVTFSDVPWQILMNYDVTKEDIEAEIKEKVTKKSYSYSTTPKTSQNNYGRGFHGIDDYDGYYGSGFRGWKGGKAGTWYNGTFYPDAEEDEKADTKTSNVVQLKGKKDDEEEDPEEYVRSRMRSPAICQLADDIVNSLEHLQLVDFGYMEADEIMYELVAEGYDPAILTDTVIGDIQKYAEWYTE